MNEILESSAVAEPLGHAPSEDDSRRIREHLKHLLTDPLFNHSKRLPAFLRYVVKEALDGVPDGQIKELTGLGSSSSATEVDLNASTPLSTGPISDAINPGATFTLNFRGYGSSMIVLKP